eukprot:TRINITY_DN7932_c0_g4_i1.p1 TRINITY_DN7932_c0_g4~~TRINITY_DN7932_c0_g4_i1.p1  ORF type:complete len:1109 (+),score=266.97 TRINITY_DN7932_c0_g4_i1:78-3329(+)
MPPGQGRWLTLAAVAVVADTSSAGTVYWEWWTGPNAAEDCRAAGAFDEGTHKDWTYEGECIATDRLISAGSTGREDPVGLLAAIGTVAIDNVSWENVRWGRWEEAQRVMRNTSITLRCHTDPTAVDPPAGGSHVDVEVRSGRCISGAELLVRFRLSAGRCPVFNHTDPASAMVNGSYHYLAAEVARVLTDAMQIRCTVCTWVFFREDPPPYVLVMTGIFVFLVTCLTVNFFLQDHLNRLVRDRKHIAPWLFGYPQAVRGGDHHSVRPGSHVWIPDVPQEVTARRRGRLRRLASMTSPSALSGGHGADRCAEAHPAPETAAAAAAAALCCCRAARRRLTPDPRQCAALVGARTTPAPSPSPPASHGSEAAVPWPQPLSRPGLGSGRGGGGGVTAAGMLDVVAALGSPDRAAPLEVTSAGPPPRRRRGTAPAPRAHPVWGAAPTQQPGAAPPPRHRPDGLMRADEPGSVWAAGCGAGAGRGLRSVDDVALHYAEHRTVHSPLLSTSQGSRFPDEEGKLGSVEQMRVQLPAAPPASGPPGQPLNLTHALTTAPPNWTSLWPCKEATVTGPVVLRHCTVCGRPGHEGTMEQREHGWKCAGESKWDRCVGKPHDPRMLVDAVPHGYADREAQANAMAGQLGRFGDVVAMREVPSGLGEPPLVQALITFHHPSAWLPSEVVEYLGDHGKLSRDDNVDESQLPRLYITDGSTAFWERLGSDFGFHIITKDHAAQRTAVQLVEDVGVWLPVAGLLKVGNFCGEYVRVGDVDEVRDAAFTHWQEWWGDFTLCVGHLRGIRQEEKGDEIRFFATVDFAGGARISIPAETLRYCSEQTYEAEALLVPQPVKDRIMLSVFVVHPILMGGKALFLCGYFGYSVFLANAEGHRGSAGVHNAWEAYEELYFRLFNSGYPSLMADFGSVLIYRVSHQDATLGQIVHSLGRPVMGCLVLAVFISFPGFVTHCLPMMFYYGWFFLPLYGGLLVCMRKLRSLEPAAPKVAAEHLYNMSYHGIHHRGYIAKAAMFHTVFRFVAETVVVILLQMSYNYGVLTYADRGPGRTYLSVIPDEYHLRAISCILEDAAETKTKLASVLI